jgi:predicted DNA-binding transcriptional regulator YafY
MPRLHRVEARKLYFDPARRHYYLWGYCHSAEGPYGIWSPRRFIRYRIGRIIPGSVQVLPDRFPAALPHVRTFQVRYRLSPRIARLGVSHHFDNTQVEVDDDGTATVSATTDDLFLTARTLLYYGPNCEVLGGKELLREFRRLVQEMAALYDEQL